MSTLSSRILFSGRRFRILFNYVQQRLYTRITFPLNVADPCSPTPHPSNVPTVVDGHASGGCRCYNVRRSATSSENGSQCVILRRYWWLITVVVDAGRNRYVSSWNRRTCWFFFLLTASSRFNCLGGQGCHRRRQECILIYFYVYW